jgi:hypothetical protein
VITGTYLKAHLLPLAWLLNISKQFVDRYEVLVFENKNNYANYAFKKIITVYMPSSE